MNTNWQHWFPRETLRRGEAYYRSDCVYDFEFKGNRCTADVFGSYIYKVKISNPGKNNMTMRCTCPHARDGFNCKHMAAVLYQWQEIEDARDEDLKYEVRPFANDEKRRPFFDFESITSEFYFKKKTLEDARTLISRGEIKLDNFQNIYERGYYGSGDTNAMAAITGTYSDNDGDREIGIIVDETRVRQYSCQKCYDNYYGWYYYGKREPCVHVTALMLLADEYSRKVDPGDNTDYNAILFLNAFGKEIVKNKNYDENRMEGCVHLEPRLIETETGIELNFKIGNGEKLYVVKNLTDLHDMYYERKTMSLGKNNAINFAVETFDKESEQLFSMIEREVKRAKAIERKMETRRSFQYAGTLETGKGIPIDGDTIDRLYGLYYGRTIECKFLSDGKKHQLRIREENPKIDIYLNSEFEITDDVKELTNLFVQGNLPIVVDGVKNHFFISKESISILDSKTYSKLAPFMSLEGSDEGRFDFLIGQKKAADFYHRVLPMFLEDPVFNVYESNDITSYIKEKAEFSFFLDAVEGQILCQTKVTYGEETFLLKALEDEELPLNGKRDMCQEEPVRELMKGWFEFYNSEAGAFVFEDNYDARYDFLKQGVNQLLEYGDVNGTDAFSKIKIRRLPVVQMGIRLENNLLDLTVYNQDMSGEELAELLNSYKLKKKYHRLRNNEYVDLEQNDSIDTLMQLLDSTGSSVRDFVKGKLQLPVYRALYIEKMLENHEELVSDRDRTYRNLIRNFKTIEDGDYDVPESLQTILRPYQAYGFKWMKTLESAGFGGILADDMGLGKTLQVISLIVSDKEVNEGADTYAIVICPASLVYNWIDEIERFAPELKAAAIVGSKKQRSEILDNRKNYDILVTSYDLLKRDVEMYEGLEFSHQIIDEAQYIKNAGSIAAKSVKLIQATNRFALTGTPIENRLSELWSIFDFLMPGFLNSYEKFRRNFELPISKNKDNQKTETLKNMIAPFILRRKKADVLKELPDKIEEMYFAKFEGEQQKLYDAQVDRIRRFIESKENDYEKSKIQILAELTKIRQICCDPALIFENYNGGSAKRDACIDLIKSAIEGEHKILLFSQFTSMLKLLEEDLEKNGIEYYKLTGETSKEDRIKMVQAFNSDSIPVFLISLKAGGTGLNLTGADIVIHYDPWWNRAAQDQATDRAHRIGQMKNVTVYQLIAKGSIEEKIVKLQNEKKELADAVLTGENRSIGSMTKEELLELLYK